MNIAFFKQGSASEATLVALLAAKMKTIRQKIEEDPSLDQYDVMSKLVVYTSDQVYLHPSIAS